MASRTLAARPINLKMPLSLSPQGAFRMNETTLDAVGDNIATLLKTNWGERPCNYHFGANLRALLFENSDTLEQAIKDRFAASVERWLPGVVIIDIAVQQGPDVDANGCHVSVTYGIANSELTGQVNAIIK